MILCFWNKDFAPEDTIELTEIDDYNMDIQQLETSYILYVPSLEITSHISFESIANTTKNY